MNKQLILILVATLTCSTVHAVPIAVLNAGFEDAASVSAPTLVPSWTDGPGSTFGATVLTPNSGLQPFEGNNLLTFQVANRILQQNLGQSLQADTRYTASVEVGAVRNVAGWGTLEILAGGNVLASETLLVNKTLETGINYSDWTTLNVTFDADSSNPFIGQELSLRLYRKNGNFSAAFDAVSLNANPMGVAEPQTGVLMLGGLLLLLRAARKRN